LKNDQDVNMLVAIRIRPQNSKEHDRDEIDIVRAEDKLLVSVPYFDILNIRSCWTKQIWSMKNRGKSPILCTDRRSIVITLTGFIIWIEVHRKCTMALALTSLTRFKRGVMLASLLTGQRGVERLILWLERQTPMGLCTLF
jgi:hypothetical protein